MIWGERHDPARRRAAPAIGRQQCRPCRDLTPVGPYFGLRSYQDDGRHYDGQLGSEATPGEFVDALIAATREMVRVLKPSGSIFVNLGDKYNSAASGQSGTGLTTISGGRHDRMGGRGNVVRQIPTKSLIGVPWRYALRCIDDLGLILRAEIIWAKSNSLPESVTDRVQRSHETWFHFTVSPQYFSAMDEIREERVPGAYQHRLDEQLGRLPRSVWEIPTQPLSIPDHVVHGRCCDGVPRPGCEDGVEHFAAFPLEWPRRIIRGWSPPDGTILDPFGGTGTTALVADVLGRHGITVDMSADYCRIATWRNTDPGERARAMQVAKPPPVAPGMLDLLELVDRLDAVADG